MRDVAAIGHTGDQRQRDPTEGSGQRWSTQAPYWVRLMVPRVQVRHAAISVTEMRTTRTTDAGSLTVAPKKKKKKKGSTPEPEPLLSLSPHFYSPAPSIDKD